MNSLYEMGHRVGDNFRATVSMFSEVSGPSKFVEEGTLTPEEFVQAGEQLCFKFPSWSWEAGNPKMKGKYLPDDKQYLITRNVRCKERVRDLDSALASSTMEGGWSLPPDTAEDPKAASGENATASSSSAGKSGKDKEVDLENLGDLDEMLAGDKLDDDIDDFVMADSGVSNAKMRTYDLSITYDKYYMTPRLWLFGYDAYSRPLEASEIFQDVLSEYHSKTVTVDPHPLTGIPTCSIHPCKHASVMKKVNKDWVDQGLKPRHDLALFVFLKFISSVVPTIDYDFTMDIEL